MIFNKFVGLLTGVYPEYMYNIGTQYITSYCFTATDLKKNLN